MTNTEQVLENLIANKVIINNNVFDAGVKYWIERQINSSHIVIVDSGWSIRGNVELLEKMLDLVNFNNSKDNDMIFSFSEGMSNRWLFLETPTNEISSKKSNIGKGGKVSVKVPYPINIRKSMQGERSLTMKKETMRDRVIQAAKDTLHRMPLLLDGSVHELGQFVNGETNIQADKRDILEGAHHMSKQFCINQWTVVIQIEGFNNRQGSQHIQVCNLACYA